MKIKTWRRLKTIVSGNDGFTLLEAVIGMMVFAIAMSAILYMDVIAINDHRRSRDNVANIHGAILQSEAIGQSVPYDHGLLAHDDSNGTDTNPNPHDKDDMPIGGQDHASYSVKGGTLVRGVKMVYMTNKTYRSNKTKLDSIYTIGVAVPNTDDVEDTNYQ